MRVSYVYMYGVQYWVKDYEKGKLVICPETYTMR